MDKKAAGLSVIAVLLLAPSLVAQRDVPVDNEWARVVVATAAPGPKGRLHRHDVNRVMVYLDKGAQRLEYVKGSARDVRFESGEAQWDPKGDLHTSQNVGGTTFRVVEVELKKPGRGRPLPPLAADSQVFRPEFENEQVRVTRVMLEPKQAVRGFGQALPRIVVPVSDVELNAGSRRISAKRGTAVFDSGALQNQRNLLDQRTEFLLIEFKD